MIHGFSSGLAGKRENHIWIDRPVIYHSEHRGADEDGGVWQCEEPELRGSIRDFAMSV
jgi:hypothetical protein